ncbi:MAG: transposase [Planctomycetota bacterium]
MATVADALRQHGSAVLDSLSVAQQKILSLITRCRTGALGGVRYRCDHCRREHWVGRSCGNRHCTVCGHEKTQAWIEKQRSRTVPVDHFLVTFTLPRELAMVVRTHQRTGYRILFDASSQSIRDVGAATRSLRGCQLGYFGVLHTWGRDVQTYHPHIHYVIPGGGVKLDEDGRPVAWQSTAKNFLFHHGTLVRVYRAKLIDAFKQADLFAKVDSSVWDKKFVVDIEPVGHAEPTLKYLAPYVHRVAISDKRIVAVDDQSVTYTVRPSTGGPEVTNRIEGEKFVRAFAQHVLPGGLMKIRHYGWMSSSSKIKLSEVKWLVWLYLGWTFWLASGMAPQPEPLVKPLRCAACGGPMRVIEVTFEPTRIDPDDRALSYFDSG